jgi:argininosuccinate synthase
MAAVENSQKAVQGTVSLLLYKGNVIIKSRSSPLSLYDEKIASMDEAGGFNPSDSNGFIKIQSIRLMAYMAQKSILADKF